MRVGYLTYGLDRTPTGIGRYAVELLRALAPFSHTCEMVLLTTEREDRHGLWELFEHHALPGCRLLPALMTVGNVMLSTAARNYQLDIIHDPNGVAPFFGPSSGVRRIVTIHDTFPFVYPATHNRLDNWRYRWQLPYAARRADAVITVSECSRDDLVRIFPLASGSVHVISEGVDPQFKPVPDTPQRQALLARYGVDQPYLLYVGGINARKNIARLLHAYALVREHYPLVKLVIAGKRQWQTNTIDKVFDQLALANHVHFTGYVHDKDLPALYSAAELFVFPSLYEGFGLPPLEAMACGTPVVTSSVSSLPEVVGDAAVTVDPFDVNALAAAIEQTLSDDVLRTMLTQRGMERVTQFTWELAARETIDVYDRVLDAIK